MNWRWVVIGGLLLVGNLQADIVGVVVENSREQYVLFEPIDLQITLQNNSSQDLVFEDAGNTRSWLDFLVVSDVTKSILTRDQTQHFDKLTLPSGQSKSLMVNVTPLYNIRQTGQYKIQVVVQIAGHEFVTSPTKVTIVNGQKIWHQSRLVDGSMRSYSLIRFTPTAQGVFLYLRVEDEALNVVYATERLGEIVSYADPLTMFDAQGNLHIIHVSGKGLYRYSRVGPKGEIQTQQAFSSDDQSRPQLVATQDGAVLVLGGRKEDASTARELLSKGQALFRKAPTPSFPAPPISPSAPGGGAAAPNPPASAPNAEPPSQPSTDSTAPH